MATGLLDTPVVTQEQLDRLPARLRQAVELGCAWAPDGFDCLCSACVQHDRRQVRATWRIPSSGAPAFACDRHMMKAVRAHVRPSMATSVRRRPS